VKSPRVLKTCPISATFGRRGGMVSASKRYPVQTPPMPLAARLFGWLCLVALAALIVRGAILRSGEGPDCEFVSYAAVAGYTPEDHPDWDPTDHPDWDWARCTQRAPVK
jgi:hypothetical protein